MGAGRCHLERERGAPLDHGRSCKFTILWWDPTSWEFQGWYANLEEPMRRTALGFDYLDQVLDIVVTPARSWHWKDEDEFALAQARRILDAAQAVAIRAEGERVIRAIEAGGWPFCDAARVWRPNPEWTPAELLPGWDVVTIGQVGQ